MRIFEVKRQAELNSKQFGVYVAGRLVEGGFFERENVYARLAQLRELADVRLARLDVAIAARRRSPVVED